MESHAHPLAVQRIAVIICGDTVCNLPAIVDKSNFIGFALLSLDDIIKAQLLAFINEFLLYHPRITLEQLCDENLDTIFKYPFANGKMETFRAWLQRYRSLMEDMFGKLHWAHLLARIILEMDPSINLILTGLVYQDELSYIEKFLQNKYRVVKVLIRLPRNVVRLQKTIQNTSYIKEEGFDIIKDIPTSFDEIFKSISKLA